MILYFEAGSSSERYASFKQVKPDKSSEKMTSSFRSILLEVR